MEKLTKEDLSREITYRLYNVQHDFDTMQSAHKAIMTAIEQYSVQVADEALEGLL